MGQPEPQMVLLRQVREAKGISQKALARQSGFQAPEISQWELGKRTIKFWQFEVLANALGFAVRLVPYEARAGEVEES